MNQVKHFIDLTRLKKPIGYMLLFWPCAWGLTLAYDFNESLNNYFFYLILIVVILKEDTFGQYNTCRHSNRSKHEMSRVYIIYLIYAFRANPTTIEPPIIRYFHFSNVPTLSEISILNLLISASAS